MASNTSNDKNDSSIPVLFEKKSQGYSRLPFFIAPSINEKTTCQIIFHFLIDRFSYNIYH